LILSRIVAVSFEELLILSRIVDVSFEELLILSRTVDVSFEELLILSRIEDGASIGRHNKTVLMMTMMTTMMVLRFSCF